MRSLLSPLLASLLLLACVVGYTTATILAKSDLEKCTRARLRDDIQCGKKIVVELSIAAGKHADEDAIMATLDVVKNASSGEVQILKDPQTIKISKSAVYMAYPITFQQKFNRRVQEQGTGMKECRKHPCYAFNDRGERITVEQSGFCCECTGLSRSDHRGMHPDCNLFLESGGSLFHAPYGTRHCLEFHRDWFPTYTVGEGQMEFTITISVFIGYDTLLSKVVLAPWDLLTATSDKSVIARLHGDLAGYTQMPEFPNFYFSRPPNTEDSSRLMKGLRPRFALTQYGEFTYADEPRQNPISHGS